MKKGKCLILSAITLVFITTGCGNKTSNDQMMELLEQGATHNEVYAANGTGMESYNIEAVIGGNEEEKVVKVLADTKVMNTPSYEGTIVGQVKKDENVIVLEESSEGGWYKIGFNGRVCYIEEDYLEMETDEEDEKEDKEEDKEANTDNKKENKPTDSTDDKPNTTTEQTSTTEKPGTTTEKPGTTTEKPGTTTEKLGTTTEESETTTEEPGSTHERPKWPVASPGTTTEEQPMLPGTMSSITTEDQTWWTEEEPVQGDVTSDDSGYEADDDWSNPWYDWYDPWYDDWDM